MQTQAWRLASVAVILTLITSACRIVPSEDDERRWLLRAHAWVGELSRLFGTFENTVSAWVKTDQRSAANTNLLVFDAAEAVPGSGRGGLPAETSHYQGLTNHPSSSRTPDRNIRDLWWTDE